MNHQSIFKFYIAKNYDTDIPDNVEVGAELIDGKWVNPAPIESVELEIVYEKISPIEFSMLFTTVKG